MNDAKLIKFAKEFRRGILGRSRSDDMCFAICAPLATLLNAAGVHVQIRDGWIDVELGRTNHYWLALPDGRVLDPTADQFNRRFGENFGAVYLGPPTRFHGPRPGMTT